MRQTLIRLTALTTLLLAGCGGSEAPAPEAGAAKPATANSSAAVPPVPEQLLVSIIPDPPIADGCLKVLVSGSRQANYRWEINGQEVPGQSANTLCEGFRRGDEVRAIVGEGKRTGSRKVTIANAPPRITGVAVNEEAIPRRETIRIVASAADVDGDLYELRYQWYINGVADPFLVDDNLPKGKYARGDLIRFTITPADSSSSGTVYQSDSLTIPNAPPQIVSQPPQRFETLEYGYQLKARDPDGDKLTYKLEKAPAGMTINRASGAIAWLLSGVKPGAYPVKIVVSDPDGATAFQEYTLTLGAPAPTPAAKKP